MSLELVSFKICPFVQRAVITLLHENIPYNITYINLAKPPEWFNSISPFGKVPVLKVDDEHIIFESAIIDEYLNEICTGNLLPTDPLQRAIDRSWIEFATNLTLDFSGMVHAKDKTSYDAKLEQTQKQLLWLERKIGSGSYFNGDKFSLVDIAYAPLFMRTDLLKVTDTLFPANDFPKLSAWSERLLTLPELSHSVVSDFDILLKSHITKNAPYAATQLNLI